MFDKLKVVALDEAINELETMLRDIDLNAQVKKYMDEDNTYESSVAIGIRKSINAARDVRKHYIKNRY